METDLDVSIMLVLEGVYRPVHAKVHVVYEFEDIGFFTPKKRPIAQYITVLECEQIPPNELQRLYEEDLLDAADETLMREYQDAAAS